MTTPHYRRLTRCALLALIAALLAVDSGCAAWRLRNAQPPSVRVSAVRLTSGSLAAQTFDLTLALTNPNDFALPIQGVAYALQVQGSTFAQGKTATSVTVPAHGRKEIHVALVTDLFSDLRQLLAWRRAGAQALAYQIDGKLKLAGVPVRLPFHYAGKLDLSRWLQAAPGRN